MPSTSGPQHRAMEAAAHGASTLGIPKSVGKDFAQADKGKTFPSKKKTPIGAMSKALRTKAPVGVPDLGDE